MVVDKYNEREGGAGFTPVVSLLLNWDVLSAASASATVIDPAAMVMME